MSKLTVETWSNGNKWSVGFSHPVKGSYFHVKSFDSIEERKAYVAKFKKEFKGDNSPQD